MSILNSLPPAERARQPANPEGALSLEIAQWLNKTNAQANPKVLSGLQLTPRCRVLEIGVGNGQAAANLAGRAAAVQYSGIDISPAMFEEAKRFNASLIASEQASFTSRRRTGCQFRMRVLIDRSAPWCLSYRK